MPILQQRSYQKELLDGKDIPFGEIKRNMQELDFINRNLGGHDITLDGIVALIKNQMHFNSRLSILEIGCGGGDNLRAIRKWAERIHLPVQLKGVDINPECIAYAHQQKRNRGIEFTVSDYKDVWFDQKPDIVFCSLFCHHFNEEELVFMLQWMRKNSQVGFFINDLHRHWLAYYSIKALTAVFSKSYLVKNDAPLSVRRGFKKEDWHTLFQKAAISNFRCQWRWAFRWLITSPNANK
ncbi:MAG: methyltransferase domain-containing protein [Flavisolibacter sp.]